MWKTKYLTAVEGMEVICWDLDSTVRSTMQRRWLIPEIWAGQATWEDYSLLCAEDAPVEGAVTLMRMLQPDYLHIAVSACSDIALDATAGWAAKHCVPLDDFLLKPPMAHRFDHKVDAVRRLQAAGLVVRLFVEDNAECAALIRERAGVPVLGVNPFDPGAVTITRESLAEAMEHRIGPEGLAAEPGSGPELAADLYGFMLRQSP